MRDNERKQPRLPKAIAEMLERVDSLEQLGSALHENLQEQLDAQADGLVRQLDQILQSFGERDESEKEKDPR